MRNVLIPHTIRQYPLPRGSVLHKLCGKTMGTSWTVQVYAPLAQGAYLQQGLQTVLDEIVRQMSHWEEHSALSRFNRAAAASWQPIPAQFCSVMQYALALREETGAAFDPCAGRLVARWGFGAQLEALARFDQPGFAPPEPDDTALHARRDGVQLDMQAQALYQPGGVWLNLSAIAKGFAVDQLAQYLAQLHLPHYLIEVGGELRGSGMKEDGQPWWVALEEVPESAPTAAQNLLALHGLSLATSGDYLQYFQHGTQRVSHTLDPRSGQALTHDVCAVNVLHAECMAADALATALMVLGPQDGLAFAEQRQLAARFVLRAATPDQAMQEIHTSAWRAFLQ